MPKISPADGLKAFLEENDQLIDTDPADLSKIKEKLRTLEIQGKIKNPKTINFSQKEALNGVIHVLTVRGGHELWAQNRRALEKVGKAFDNICPMIIQPAPVEAKYHRAAITKLFADKLVDSEIPFFDLIKNPEAAFFAIPNAMAVRNREAANIIS